MTRVTRIIAALWPLLALVALVLAVAGLASLADQSIERAATLAMVNLIIVVGIYIFVGNSGIVSFGHVSFVAIGGYVGALVTIPSALKGSLLPALPEWLAGVQVSPTVGVLIGAAAAGLFAIVLAGPILRLEGIAAGIATLAVLIAVNVVISNWQDVTRGTATMVGIPTAIDLGAVLPWVIGVLVVAFAYQTSRSGLRLRASREEMVGASASGVNVVRERRIAFVLSGVVCGAGGAVYGQFLGSLSPGDVFFALTILTLLMLVVGGMTSLAGAVVGVLFVSIVAELLRRVEDGGDLGLFVLAPHPGIQQIVLALLLLATLIFRPGGIMRGKEIPSPFPASRPAARPAPDGDLTGSPTLADEEAAAR